MGNTFLSAFACVVALGVGVACVPRLLAPSDTYISDTLNPVEKFYFTAEPDNISLAAGERATFITATNIIDNVLYQWQVSTDTGVTWSDLDILGSDRDILRFTSTAAEDGYFYRCMATYEDIIIYTAPVLLSVLLEDTTETTTESITTTQGGEINV